MYKYMIGVAIIAAFSTPVHAEDVYGPVFGPVDELSNPVENTTGIADPGEINSGPASEQPVGGRGFSGPYVGFGLTLDNYSGSGDAEGLGGVSGIGGTAYAGYDYKINDRIFIGAEANADFASADANITGVPVESEWGWGVGGRVGYMVNDKTALYTRVGYARQRVQVANDKFWLDAVRYGGGVETFISDRIAVRAEFSQFNAESSVTNNQVTAGLLYRF